MNQKEADILVPLLSHNKSTGGSNETSVKLNFCSLCLRENLALTMISSCIHFSVANIFQWQESHYYDDKLVCSECHNMLKRICRFIEMALENYKLLQSQSYLVFSTNKDNLQYSKIELIYTVESQPLEYEILESSPKTKTENNLSETFNYNTRDSKELNGLTFDEPTLETEVIKDLIECTNYKNVIKTNDFVYGFNKSDSESDVLPLVKFKSQKKLKRVNKKNQEVKRKRKEQKRKKKLKIVINKEPNRTRTDERFTNNRHGGKIRMLLISYEEMMEERRIESEKEAYLRKIHRCDSCIIAFDHKETLEEHIAKRHEIEGYTCEVCKSVQNTEASHKEHYKRHFRRYECEACGKRISYLYSALKHYSDKHGCINTEYKCSECNYTSPNQRQYRYHLEKHKGKVPCPECRQLFVTKGGLRNHITNVHKYPLANWACRYCDKRYRGKPGLLSHLQTVHEKPKPLISAYCIQCDVEFKTERALIHHLRTSAKHITEQDKRFECDECGGRYVTKAKLREHIDWAHRKVTKHVCPTCSKSFRNRTQLNKHVNYVHEKKRQAKDKICDHCGKAFRTLQQLRPHIRTHTGERPLRCVTCDATFAHPASLYTHCKLLHANVNIIKRF